MWRLCPLNIDTTHHRRMPNLLYVLSLSSQPGDYTADVICSFAVSGVKSVNQWWQWLGCCCRLTVARETKRQRAVLCTWVRVCVCKIVVKEKEMNERGSMDERQEKNNGWVECVYVCVCRGWVGEWNIPNYWVESCRLLVNSLMTEMGLCVPLDIVVFKKLQHP